MDSQQLNDILGNYCYFLLCQFPVDDCIYVAVERTVSNVNYCKEHLLNLIIYIDIYFLGLQFFMSLLEIMSHTL